MTEGVIVALIVSLVGAIPPTLAILISHRASTKRMTSQDDQLTHIVALTNSNWSAAQKRIAVLQNEIASLKEIRRLDDEEP